MNPKKWSLSLFILFVFSLAFCQEKVLTEKEKRALIKEHYTKAIMYYQAEDYGKAISYYEQILNLDPQQVQPSKLTELCRKKIREKYSKFLEEINRLVSDGKYNTAYEKMSVLVQADPNNPELKNYYGQLDSIKNIFSELTDNNKPSQLIRKSVSGYLKNDWDIKPMLHCGIYAAQLAPGDSKIEKYISLIKEKYPKEYKSVEIVPGMTIVEQKLVAALNYIYDAKYDRAIVECNDVIELEPKSILAFKRLGSAYYALKKEKEAKAIWGGALKIDPQDEELKRFLKNP